MAKRRTTYDLGQDEQGKQEISGEHKRRCIFHGVRNCCDNLLCND